MASRKQIIYPIIILILGVVVFGGVMSMKKAPADKEYEPKLPVVLVEEVDFAPIKLNVVSQGVVNPRYETRLVAQVGGEIVELSEAFVRGGFVAKGQLLARIDPSDYETALIDAEANYAAAIAALEIEQAAGHVAEEEWKNISTAEPSDLGLRRPQLKQEQARVKAASAAVKRAKRNLERTRIVAPFDALIESRNIGLGSYVGTGSELGKVFNTSVAEVRLPIPTNELQYLVENGLNAQVDLNSQFAGKNVTWNAKVVRSEGVIDTQSRMSYLVAEVQSPYEQTIHEQALRFGTYVTAKVYGVDIPSAAVVPRHLVKRNRVAILDNEKRLRFRTVVVAREQDQDAVITEGLDSGDQIITSALDYPVDGMELALKADEVDLKEDEEKAESGSQVALQKD